MVSTSELKSILGPSFNEDVSKYDINGDGEISFDEFMELMRKIK